MSCIAVVVRQMRLDVSLGVAKSAIDLFTAAVKEGVVQKSGSSTCGAKSVPCENTHSASKANG